MADKKELLEKIKDSLIAGKAKDVDALVKEAKAQGIPAEEILGDGLIAGMDVVGQKFRAEEFYIPEVLVAARAMKVGIALIEGDLAKKPELSKGTIVIGTVAGDLHDIGKNLVALMLTGAGFKVEDLGIDVPSDKFVAAAKEKNADAVAISALLTTTMVNMKEVVSKLKAAGYKGKTIIGGAPVTAQFAKEIGADLYAEDAAEAVVVLKEALK